MVDAVAKSGIKIHLVYVQLKSLKKIWNTLFHEADRQTDRQTSSFGLAINRGTRYVY